MSSKLNISRTITHKLLRIWSSYVHLILYENSKLFHFDYLTLKAFKDIVIILIFFHKMSSGDTFLNETVILPFEKLKILISST